MSRRVAVRCGFVAVASVASVAWGQVPVLDSPKFRQPLLMVSPDRPAGEKGNPRFDVEVQVDAKGRVQGAPTVSPDTVAIRRNLGEVAEYWRFYPQVDAQRCEPVPSAARVVFEFDESTGAPRVFLVYNPLKGIFQSTQPRLVQPPEKPSYPKKALGGNAQGDFYLLLKVAPDGTVSEARELIGSLEGAYAEPLWRAAKRSALTARFEAGDAPLRCSAMLYSYILE